MRGHQHQRTFVAPQQWHQGIVDGTRVLADPHPLALRTDQPARGGAVGERGLADRAGRIGGQIGDPYFLGRQFSGDIDQSDRALGKNQHVSVLAGRR